MMTRVKKYAFLALSAGALLVASCSKDDGPGKDPEPVDPVGEKPQLVLSTSVEEITVGQEVDFEVAADGEAVVADIYIDDSIIDGTTHTFDQVGTYGAVAKKEGYLDSEKVQIEVLAEKKKVAQATFSKLDTQAYPITYPGHYYDRIALLGEHIYLMNDEQQTFGRYSLTSNQWDEMASLNTLYRGIAGYLTPHRGADGKEFLIYLGGGRGHLNTYFPPEYPDVALRDTWATKVVSPEGGMGERAAASDGEYIYFMGNGREGQYSRQIDRYVPAHDLWEEGIGYLPLPMDEFAQAIFNDNKIYVTGISSTDDNVFLVYDLLTQTAESKPFPKAPAFNYTSYNNTMVVYQDYLIYMLPSGVNSPSVSLYVYDLEEGQWLEDEIKVEMDLFSKSSENASLLLSDSGKLYVAGAKAGDFVVYEVDFSVIEQ